MKFSSSLFLFLAVIACFMTMTYASGGGARPETPFSFRSLLADETDHFLIQQIQPTTFSGEQEVIHEDYFVQAFFAKQNETKSLVGHSYKNFTNAVEVSDYKYFNVDFDEKFNETVGTILVRNKNGDYVPFITFNFTMVNGIAFSSGNAQLQCGKKALYTLSVPAPDRFVLTLVFEDKQEIFIAKKIPIVTPQTFFQKYGSFFMMGALMIFQLFVQSKTKDLNQQPGATEEELQRELEEMRKQAQLTKAAAAPAQAQQKATSEPAKGGKSKSKKED